MSSPQIHHRVSAPGGVAVCGRPGLRRAPTEAERCMQRYGDLEQTVFWCIHLAGADGLSLEDLREMMGKGYEPWLRALDRLVQRRAVIARDERYHVSARLEDCTNHCFLPNNDPGRALRPHI